MVKMFRDLKPDEVELRVGRAGEYGNPPTKYITLLLYKDARCDMNILDETIGPLNWQRRHSRDNQNCTVAIYNRETGEWIEKEDTGTESNQDAAKGLASDSFKRACVNWGIGRELYTAPDIFIKEKDDQGKVNFETKQGKNGKWQPKADFRVEKMTVEEGRITALEIRNRKRSNKIVFSWGEDEVDRGQQSLPLPETPPAESPVSPAVPSQGNNGQPVPYEPKNRPAPPEDPRAAAIAEFRSRYPNADILAIGAIFGTNKETTPERWAEILQELKTKDFSAEAAKHPKQEVTQ